MSPFPQQRTEVCYGAQQADMLDSESQRVLLALDAFCATLKLLGKNIRSTSPRGLEKLDQETSEKKQAIAEHFENWKTWISPGSELEMPGGKNFYSAEDSALKRALSHWGLEASDEFWKTIDDETIVEVYGHDMVQLYRSYSMLEMTSYSLLDLSLFEWYNLWERPALIIKNMHDRLEAIKKDSTSCVDFSIEPHVLRETKDTGMTEPFVPRATLIKFQKIGLLKRLRDDSPWAFMCTAKARVLASGEDALKIGIV